MNVFLWGSVILCDIVGAIVYVVTRILLGYGFSPYLSTYYILMSMLLALVCACRREGTPVFCPSDQDEMDVNF